MTAANPQKGSSVSDCLCCASIKPWLDALMSQINHLNSGSHSTKLCGWSRPLENKPLVVEGWRELGGM